MPHVRKRQIDSLVQNSLKLSPIVGILGHRQVGKTTLLEQLCTKYYVLDTKSAKDEVQSNPHKFLTSKLGSPTAFDECQYAPDLFTELKEWVRTHKKPGQFLLSGSVRFTSREIIKESLTGRIVTHELLPMTLSELENRPLPNLLLKIQDTSDLSNMANQLDFQTRQVVSRHKKVLEYFEKGGLPGVCFLRDAKQRIQKIEQQLFTILDRDLRLVRKLQLSFSDIRALVGILANMQGIRVDLTEIKRQSGLSAPTIKKLLYCLEAVYILRVVKSTGTTNGHTLFFEDMAEANYLRTQEANLTDQLIHFCFTQFRAIYQYRVGEPYSLFQYATRSGAIVPLCFQNKRGTLGILCLEHPDELSHYSGTIRSFLSRYTNSKILAVHMANEKPRLISERTLALPIALLV